MKISMIISIQSKLIKEPFTTFFPNITSPLIFW